MLLDLGQMHLNQGDLFVDTQGNHGDALMPVLDRLNARFPGSLTLGRSIVGHGGASSWNMKREYLSPAYTTSWYDLPVVR